MKYNIALVGVADDVHYVRIVNGSENLGDVFIGRAAINGGGKSGECIITAKTNQILLQVAANGGTTPTLWCQTVAGTGLNTSVELEELPNHKETNEW